jgi:hypothetical protein
MRLDDGRTLNRNGRDDFHCPIGMHGDVAMNVRV